MGITYSSELTKAMLEESQQSTIAKAQAKSNIDVLSGTPFVDEEARDRAELYLILGSTLLTLIAGVFPSRMASG